MPFTTYLEDLVLNYAYGNATPPSIATRYVGLSTTLPNAAGGNITEPTIGTNGYTRVAYTNNTTNFPTTAADAKSNATAITFPTSTGAWLAGAALGYFFFSDAATGGNILDYATLNSPQMVAGSGATISFAIGAFTGSLS
jgi:hypothetical protein